MTQVSTRELLQELTELPIGSPELQVEADATARARAQMGKSVKPSPKLQETIDRAAKKWLPQGKRRVSREEAIAATRAFYANQTDIEDAVEAAGGKRGSVKAA